MKYCQNCGKENSLEAVYCKDCGTKISQVEETVSQTTTAYTKPKSEGLGIAAMVIGIISLVFAFIFNLFVIPLAFIGLILGVVNKALKGKKISGIVLNVIAIIISVIVFFVVMALISVGIVQLGESGKLDGFLNALYNELDYSSSDNYAQGTWDCKGFDGGGESDDYQVTLKLNKDNTFVYGKYGDLENNHASGTYEIEDEKEKNESTSNGYKYFMLTFTGDEFISDGKDQGRNFNSKAEMGITAVNTKKQAVMIFTSSYNMYYCYKK